MAQLFSFRCHHQNGGLSDLLGQYLCHEAFKLCLNPINLKEYKKHYLFFVIKN